MGGGSCLRERGCLHRSSGVQLPLSRRIPSRTTPAARCPALFVVCILFLSVSNLSCRLSLLLGLDNLLDLNLHLMFFVLRLPSLQSTWLLQRSVAVCYPSCCFCVTSLSTRLLSASLPQSPFQSQPRCSLAFSATWCSLAFSATFNSCPAAMHDGFQCPCFSSSVQLLSSRLCSPHTSRPAVGYALDCLLLAVLFSPAVGCALLACCWLCSFAS